MRHTTIVFYFIELFVLLFKYFDLPSYSREGILVCLVMAILNLFIFVRARKSFNISSKYALVTYLFVIGYFIVFFQRYFDLLFGLREPSDFCFASEGTIMKCVTISLIGQCAFYLGNILFRFGSIKREKNQSYVDISSLKLLFMLSTVVFFVFNGYKLFSYSYSQDSLAAEAGTMVLYSSMFYQILLVLILSYTVCNSKILQFNRYRDYYRYLGMPFHICILFYALFYIIIGDRGPLIVCACVYVGAYLIAKRSSVKLTNLVLPFAISVSILFVIGETRNMGKDVNLSEKIGSVYDDVSTSDSSILPVTDELASSVLTLHYSVEHVPDFHPHVYGVFTLRTIASWIPFSDRIISSFIKLDPRYRSSAFFITWLIQGDKYTYGNGSSCNADLYLGFGVWGVLIGLFLWGIFLHYLESCAAWKTSINFWIIYLFTIGYAIYVNRSDLLVFGNYVIFTIILNAIWRLFYNKSEY